MELGFETIGNATIICHDHEPILATDPWLQGSAYFGSWGMSHEVPPAQKDAVRNARYVWFSHGHPDHLNPDSLGLLRDRRVLVPDHAGGRIYRDLVQQGFSVRVLPSRVWVELSPRVRVQCIPDYNQDAVLLIDMGGRLLINLNDAGDRGWGRYVREVSATYPVSFLLALAGYGDADMINFHDENGRRLPPYAALKTPVGQTIARQADYYGVRYVVPSSSMHRYQRADSVWASEYSTPLEDHGRGFHSERAELLPAFIRFDLLKNGYEEIRPPCAGTGVLDPKEFGDDWSERLEPDDVRALNRYIRSVRHLSSVLDFVTFRVGGRDCRIALGSGELGKGVSFEAPRRSLMTAVAYEIFDDSLIGNFMKTTLHGEWGPGRLYPDFTPFIAKYGDNGRARTEEELEAYFRSYRQHDLMGYLRHRFESGYVRPLQNVSSDYLRRVLGEESNIFRAAKNAYWGVKRGLF